MKKSSGTMVAIMVVAILIGLFITAKYSSAEEGRFIAHHNGTVLDTKTNLMWAAKDNGSNINLTDAKSYCEKYQGGRCRQRMSYRGCMTNQLSETTAII
jgi:hypothetical protein